MTLENEIRTKIETPLAQFLQSSGPDALKWFIEKDGENNTNFIESDTILNAFWDSFVKNGPHDEEIFEFLVAKTPDAQKDKITNLLCGLVESKDPNQYSTLIKIVSEEENSWSSEIKSKILEVSLKIAQEMGHPHNIQLFQAVINSLNRYDSNKLESIAEKILPLTFDNNPTIQNDAFGLLKTINLKLDRYGKQIGVKESIDKAKEFFEKNDPKVQPYLDYTAEYSDKLTYDERSAIIDLIKEQITLTKPDNIRMIGLNFLLKLNGSERERLADEIIELANQVKEDNTKNLCKDVLIATKDDLNYYKKKKVKTLFGDTVFD